MAWNLFAEGRKAFQLDYQLLSQPFELSGTDIKLLLNNAIQETTFNDLRVELLSFLREQLRNGLVQISYEIRVEETSKKVMYTPREKLDYLTEKNPLVKLLKDRLGLDTDF
ncbi:MAG: hypothetical protein HC859_01330 [Bacteroidia bacterium]|nr:hypothetical protein [Bacteroidia bacterium]